MSEPTMDPKALALLEDLNRIIREQGEELERFRRDDLARCREDDATKRSDQARRERLGVAVNIASHLLVRGDRDDEVVRRAVRLADDLLATIGGAP